MSGVSRSLRASALAAALALAHAAVPAAPASAHVVCVDPGHGGADPGAVGICEEESINLGVSNYLLYLLQHDASFEGSFATRTTDISVALSQRVALATAGGAEAFVSLHHNSGVTIRTFVMYDTTGQQASRWTRSRALATASAERLCVEFSTPHALDCDGVCVDQAPQCSGSTLYVLRENPLPSALGEPCGVGAAEAARLCSTSVYPDYMEEARGYYQGLREFFGLTAIGTSFQAAGGPGADTLRWTESDPERWVTYAIERSDACWGPWQPIASIVSHDDRYTPDDMHYTYIDGTVSYARPYWYRLSVTDERATAVTTPAALPPATPPPAPQALVAEGAPLAGGRASVSLEWAAQQAAGFHVYRSLYESMSDCGAAFDRIATTSATAFTDTTAPSGIPLFYRVRAYNATGGSEVSPEAALVVDSRTGAPEPHESAASWPWPNPASRVGAVHVTLPHNGHVRASLHDVAGRRVALLLDARRLAGDLELPLDSGTEARLSRGVYFIQVLLDGRPLGTRRLVLLQ